MSLCECVFACFCAYMSVERVLRSSMSSSDDEDDHHYGIGATAKKESKKTDDPIDEVSLGKEYGKGFSMLKKMGFKTGGGLGPEGREGISVPIEVATRVRKNEGVQDLQPVVEPDRPKVWTAADQAIFECHKRVEILNEEQKKVLYKLYCLDRESDGTEHPSILWIDAFIHDVEEMCDCISDLDLLEQYTNSMRDKYDGNVLWYTMDLEILIAAAARKAVLNSLMNLGVEPVDVSVHVPGDLSVKSVDVSTKSVPTDLSVDVSTESVPVDPETEFIPSAVPMAVPIDVSLDVPIDVSLNVPIDVSLDDPMDVPMDVPMKVHVDANFPKVITGLRSIVIDDDLFDSIIEFDLVGRVSVWNADLCVCLKSTCSDSLFARVFDKYIVPRIERMDPSDLRTSGWIKVCSSGYLTEYFLPNLHDPTEISNWSKYLNLSDWKNLVGRECTRVGKMLTRENSLALATRWTSTTPALIPPLVLGLLVVLNCDWLFKSAEKMKPHLPLLSNICYHGPGRKLIIDLLRGTVANQRKGPPREFFVAHTPNVRANIGDVLKRRCETHKISLLPRGNRENGALIYTFGSTNKLVFWREECLYEKIDEKWVEIDIDTLF